ncbi:hypothetical protein CROQUDRAFT_100916 [Cronartium quercuum f. sp. fusiforme G11]|uniref:Uncharacterized protein n=1 Tax=Cronartium quercuum f. sp. fusiforme G11 TaxID=708437 RepID=A0A9P6N5S6_9BASI|nr:hypothetical protein CROQUDRAFT_100916 [Cronartium quercuum f. sp. fusiforme G11]
MYSLTLPDGKIATPFTSIFFPADIASICLKVWFMQSTISLEEAPLNGGGVRGAAWDAFGGRSFEATVAQDLGFGGNVPVAAGGVNMINADMMSTNSDGTTTSPLLHRLATSLFHSWGIVILSGHRIGPIVALLVSISSPKILGMDASLHASAMLDCPFREWNHLERVMGRGSGGIREFWGPESY